MIFARLKICWDTVVLGTCAMILALSCAMVVSAVVDAHCNTYEPTFFIMRWACGL